MLLGFEIHFPYPGFSFLLTFFIILLLLLWSPLNGEWAVVHVICGAVGIEQALWRFIFHGAADLSIGTVFSKFFQTLDSQSHHFLLPHHLSKYCADLAGYLVWFVTVSWCLDYFLLCI